MFRKNKTIVLFAAFMMQIIDVSAQAMIDSMRFESSILITPSEMPVKDGHLIVLPNQGLFIVGNNTFFSLDEERCPVLDRFKVLERFPIEQVVVNNGIILAKCQQFVFSLGAEKTEIIAELDMEEFAIFKGHDNFFNIVLQEEDGQFAWYEYDIEKGDMDCVMRQELPIKNIISVGEAFNFIIIENNLCLVDNENCTEVVKSDVPIIDAVFSPYGLFFCTDNQLYLYHEGRAILIANGSFFSLYNDGDVLYVVQPNGVIYKISLT